MERGESRLELDGWEGNLKCSHTYTLFFVIFDEFIFF